jgi:hypothetical protein
MASGVKVIVFKIYANSLEKYFFLSLQFLRCAVNFLITLCELPTRVRDFLLTQWKVFNFKSKKIYLSFF